ncbi:hypothetical protein NONI108955_19350 [Nocardia ninae]
MRRALPCYTTVPVANEFELLGVVMLPARMLPGRSAAS